MENMFDLMNEKIEVRDEPNALPLMPMRGKVDFRNVSFSYTPEKPVLKNITFTVNPGEVCAIVSFWTWRLVQNAFLGNFGSYTTFSSFLRWVQRGPARPQ